MIWTHRYHAWTVIHGQVVVACKSGHTPFNGAEQSRKREALVMKSLSAVLPDTLQKSAEMPTTWPVSKGVRWTQCTNRYFQISNSAFQM